MLAFYIENTEIKYFMQKLFNDETFDKLELRSLELETIIKYELLGNINKDYLKEGEKRHFVRWGEIRNIVYNLIKGAIKPKYMKIVFSLEDNAVYNLCENASAMFLNINYYNDEITFTTGTSQKNFSLSKIEDKIWEDTILKFFKKNNININIIN